MAEIPSGGGGTTPSTGGGGSVRIADITPQSGGDVVDNKDWQDAAQTVLRGCRTTTLDLNVEVVGTYPKVSVDGNPAEMDLAADGGHYSKQIPITVAGAAISSQEIHYAMNEDMGADVPDSSGNANDGTTINMDDTNWVVGKLGNGLEFNGPGQDESVNCGNTVAVFERTNPFSFEAWIRTTADIPQYFVSRVVATDVQKGWWIASLTGGVVEAILQHDGAGAADRLQVRTNIADGGFIAVNDGAWHHVVFTYDGSSSAAGTHLWVDGTDQVLTVVLDTLTDSILAGAPNLVIGRRSFGSGVNFTGTMDEVVVYSKELTSSEVAVRYNGGAGTEDGGGTAIVARLTTPDDLPGTEDSASITLEAPPTITALSFTGGYPGAQTEVAEGQTYDITVTASKSFNRLLVADQDAGDGNGAGADQIIDVAPGPGPTVVSITIADRGVTPQLLPAHVRVRDTVTGALSASRSTNELGGGVDETDVVNLNDRYPVIDGVGKGGATGHAFGIAYPGAQGALKGSEPASVTAPVTFFDAVAYSAPGGELDVTPLGVYADPKVVTRIAGSYNVSSDNFRVTANRAANGTQTIVQGVVRIAHVTALATASFSGARVRSGIAPGNDTLITLSFNQLMAGTPTMDPAASRGTFLGSWSGAGSSWTRTLRVPDADNPADNSANAWTNISATNLAGIPTSVITTGPTYIVGGLAQRLLTYPPLTPNSVETFPLTDENKLVVGAFSNGNAGVIQPFGTPDTAVGGREGWCAPTVLSGTSQLRMLHTPTVAANGAGITLSFVEETA